MECLKRNLFGRNYLASGVFFSNGFVYGTWICDRRSLHLFYNSKVTMCTTKKVSRLLLKRGGYPSSISDTLNRNGIDSCQVQVGWYSVENIMQ